MGRPRKSRESGLPPLREWWQEINRQKRQEEAELRGNRKGRDQRRTKCRCDAYKFPHRPGGGLCRYPNSPEVRWQDAQAAEIAARVAKFTRRWGEPTPEQMQDLTALTTKPYRPYRDRYAGLRRQIARANGLHPIRDRAAIQRVMFRAISQAKHLKRQCAKLKFRNMKINDKGMTGYWTTAGPTM